MTVYVRMICSNIYSKDLWFLVFSEFYAVTLWNGYETAITK